MEDRFWDMQRPAQKASVKRFAPGILPAMGTNARHCSSLSDSLEPAADGIRHKAVNAAKHFSTALSPLPYGQNLSLFHLPRIPEDVRALFHL